MNIAKQGLALLAAAAITAGAGCNPDSPSSPQNAGGGGGGGEGFTPGPAPAWELKDFDGKTVKSTDFAGKVVVLDFWATWCPPCRQEIPGFIALQSKYGKEGLAVVGVDVGPEEADTVKKYMKNVGINYPVVAGTDALAEAYGGIEGIPTTFIIDRQGKMVHRHVGYASQQQFEGMIKPLLAAGGK